MKDNIVQIRPFSKYQCSKCGVDASCDCGAPLVSKASRIREAIEADPGKPNKQIAREVGADPQNVRRERKKLEGVITPPDKMPKEVTMAVQEAVADGAAATKTAIVRAVGATEGRKPDRDDIFDREIGLFESAIAAASEESKRRNVERLGRLAEKLTGIVAAVIKRKASLASRG